MGDVINLRRVRKRRAKEDAEQVAAVNRAAFGRTQLERETETAKQDRAARMLDQHKLPEGDPT